MFSSFAKKVVLVLLSVCFLASECDLASAAGNDNFPVNTKSVSESGAARLSRSRARKKNRPRIASVFTATAISHTSLQLNFTRRMKLKLDNLKLYAVFPALEIKSATPNIDRTSVYLQTGPQEETSYTIKIRERQGKVNRKKRKGVSRLDVDFASFSGMPQPLPPDIDKPYVIGAISTSNTSLIVGYSEPMGDTAINPSNYQIVQENVNPEVGNLKVLSAKFADSGRFSVSLVTASQNEVTYRVTANNVFDLAGNPLEAKRAGINVLVDPTSALFAGTPPGGDSLVDSDGDYLSDNEELRGWEVTILLSNGKGVVRQVTSDPANADTDGDGLPDGLEKALVIDPRDWDTDDDELSDYSEFNETFSDPIRQDSDGDSLYDGLEFNFFKTSPLFEDTDGDQLDDSLEVVTANRNPRIADLPLPYIEIGDVNLQLDVRFTATSSTGSRELEAKSVQTTLQQTESKKFSSTNTTSHEFTSKVGVEQGWEVGKPLAGAEGKVSVEVGYTGHWESSYTNESSNETQKSVAKSFNTEKEATTEESVSREIQGASMKVGVTIRSLGNTAFKVKNLQIAAFFQDPRNPARLIPIATLLPDSGVPNEFAMGPLVPERGPFVFTNDQIFPALIQDLMLDPRGLTFKIANYDVEDEIQRNFAFTSQEINDRTAAVVLDFGGADTDGDGTGDTTEKYRVATSSGRVIDTNDDGVVDDNDRRVTFDLNGKQVGITLIEALESIIGLTYYREEDTPTSSLTPFQQENSFSTQIVDGVETLWRVRRVSQELSNPLKAWIVITTKGFDPTIAFSDYTLSPEKPLVLAFVQDLDGDGVTANWEYTFGCSDTKEDTDGDGLKDNEEVYLGWIVDVVGKGSYKAYSSCARKDTDLDGLTDQEEATRTIDIDTDNDMVADLFDVPAPLDPRNPDTDKDGMSDFEEINGYTIVLRFPEDTDNDGNPDLFLITATSDPLNPDTDGDTIKDGDEFYLGTNPNKDDGDKVFDDDGDGLRNFEETAGFMVSWFETSSSALTQGTQRTCTPLSYASCAHAPFSDPTKEDTDGDGLSDRQERDIGTNPAEVDTDGDGLSDAAEVKVEFIAGEEIISNVTDPLDADIDNDLRSDGAEINTPWTVSVVGETPRQVFSDPLVADEDLDTLVDGLEISNGGTGTDPTLPDGFDTDGDGVSDYVERTGSARGTNPLEADQKATFAYTNVKVVGDCEPSINSPGEFRGKIQIQNSPDEASPTTVNDLFSSGAGNHDEGTDTAISASRTYVLNAGDTAIMKSSGLCEEDDSGSSGDDCDVDDEALTDFSKQYPYPVSSTVEVVSADNGATDCKLEFTITITPINN